MNSYKYRVLCPEFDPPNKFRRKSLIPRQFWTTPDRLLVLCESTLRKILQPKMQCRGDQQRRMDFWTVIEPLLPPLGQIQLRHYRHDKDNRRRDYLNHWDQLTLELVRAANPQFNYPRIIIGRQRKPPQGCRNTIESIIPKTVNPPAAPAHLTLQPARIKCSIKNFRVCEIQVNEYETK